MAVGCFSNVWILRADLHYEIMWNILIGVIPGIIMYYIIPRVKAPGSSVLRLLVKPGSFLERSAML